MAQHTLAWHNTAIPHVRSPSQRHFQTDETAVITRRRAHKVILELKSIDQIAKVHAKQVFTYLKLTGLKLGFVLNFGFNIMKHGIERVVCGLPEEAIDLTQRG